MILDDHAVVREGLRLLLEREADIEIVAEAGSLRDALEVDAEPDVILSDLVLGDARGVQTVTGLRGRFPGAAILVLTMVSNPNEVHLNLAAGARGYLLKEVAAEQVTGAIRKVAAGEEYLEPSLGAMMMRSSEQEGPAGLPALSEREREVLRLVALGHTTAEIAVLLQMAPRTVEAHRAHIMQKLDLRSRAELVRFAVKSGLVEFSPNA